jgi:multiple sugar transport system substrate-binding protein
MGGQYVQKNPAAAASVSRRRFLSWGAAAGTLVGTGAMASFLSSCSTGTSVAPPGTNFTGQLGLLLGSHMEAVKGLAQEYNAKYGFTPKVEEITTPDLRSKLTTSFLAQSSPYDAAFATSVIAQEMAKNNWALPVDGFLDQTPRKNETFLENALAPVKYQGLHYGTPWSIGAPLLHWNKAMFEEVGLDPEAPNNWHSTRNSWDTFIEYAKELTGERNGEQYYGFTDAWASDHKLYTFGSLLQMHGGRFLDAEGEPAFDSDAGEEAIMKMYDLINTHKVVDPAVETYTWVFDASPGYFSGTRGMIFTWPFIAGVAQDPETSKVVGVSGVAPQPSVDTSASVDGSEYFFVPSLAKNPDEGWRFLELMSSKEAQTAIAETGWASIYGDVNTAPAMLEKFPYYQAIADSYKYPVDGGFSADRDVWGKILANEISEVFADKKSAKDALANAKKLMNQERES